jgi:hypothetical protein
MEAWMLHKRCTRQCENPGVRGCRYRDPEAVRNKTMMDPRGYVLYRRSAESARVVPYNMALLRKYHSHASTTMSRRLSMPSPTSSNMCTRSTTASRFRSSAAGVPLARSARRSGCACAKYRQRSLSLPVPAGTCFPARLENLGSRRFWPQWQQLSDPALLDTQVVIFSCREPKLYSSELILHRDSFEARACPVYVLAVAMLNIEPLGPTIGRGNSQNRSATLRHFSQKDLTQVVQCFARQRDPCVGKELACCGSGTGGHWTR